MFMVAKIEAVNITKTFERNKSEEPLQTLNGINLKISAGDFVCLVGPSGCGKSTFLRIVAGIKQPDTGQLLVDGHIISNDTTSRIMVFQESALFPWLTVRDNVEFGLKMRGIPNEKRARMSELYLDMMQLTPYSNLYTYQLSTGMKERVAIARALVLDPDILLMDEPFAALDPITREQLIVEMKLIWARTKKTILFVTHDIAEAVTLGTKIAVFSKKPSVIKEIIDNVDNSMISPSPHTLATTKKNELKNKIQKLLREK